MPSLHTWYIGKTFLQIQQRPLQQNYPQELNPRNSNISEHIHPSHAGKSENQTPVQDQRCQSGPSARYWVIPSEGDSSKSYGADQQRLQISDLHFDKFPTPATFACWKIRFKTEVCTCSHFPTEAILWIKEMELVDSGDDLKSSCSVRGIRMPDFQVLDEKIASALNRIIHNTQIKERSVWRNKKPKKRTVSFVEDRSLPWSTSTSGSQEPLITSRIMPTYLLLLFEVMIFRNSIRNWTEIYYPWRKSHLMTYWKDCTNWEYESLRNSRPYWNCTTWRFFRRKQDLIFIDWGQKRKLWKKRRGQESGTKQRRQRTLEIVGNGKPTGSVLKETIAVSVTMSMSVQKWHSRIRPRVLSCSRMTEMRREPEVPEERVPVVECFDCPARITSKELAPIHSVKSGTLQNACSTSPRMVADFGKSALMRIAKLMNSLAKWSKKNGDRSAVAMLKKHEPHDRTGRPVVCDSSNTRQLGCVFQDMEPPKSSSILRKSSNIRKPDPTCKIHESRCTSRRHSKPNPSLGLICPNDLISVAPTLQIWGSGLRRRQSCKSKEPVKQRGGWQKCSKMRWDVKTTPHKTVFAVWNYTRNLRTSQKLNKFVQRQIEFTKRSTAKSQQCVKWYKTLGESVSVVDANAWAIMHWRSFVFVVSLFCCQFVSLPFDCLPCKMHAHFGSSLSPIHPIVILMFSWRTVSVASDLFDFSLHFISFLISLLSPCCSCCPTPSSSFMSWTNTLRTSAEDFGTLAENEPPTSYESNDHFITEADVEYTQESSGPQWLRLRWRHHRQDAPSCVPQTSRSLWRRRPDVLSVVVSSVTIERVKHCCCLPTYVERLRTQRHNSVSEQIRTLLERQREEILADCQAEIQKHEFQVDYDRRSIQKLTETIESQKQVCRAHHRRRTTSTR